MLPAGTRLGRYELIRRFASGGMAELYVARAAGISGFEKIVALKRILPQYARNEDFVEMFLDEARLTATIQHNNVAQVYDIGQCDDGLFFTMEYVHGADLRAVLHVLSKREARMPLAHALTVGIGAAAGLHAAHERTSSDGRPLGIVHRDITPSNVLVSFDGCVKLIDFGIAKAERRTTETRAGTLKGKIAYMSPEQCAGEKLDRRSDVFSLGIVLFEATTGTRLFAAENEYAALRQIVDRDAPRPSSRCPDYPPALEEIVVRALRRDRDERYPTALALEVDLEEFARASGLAISTAKLGAWMREVLPERAAELLVDDRMARLALPLPPPIARGSGRNPAIPVERASNDNSEPIANLADELEPSISIQPASTVGPSPAGPELSAVSRQLAELHRQRRVHFTVALSLAAVVCAFVAATALLMRGSNAPVAPRAATQPAVVQPIATQPVAAQPVAAHPVAATESETETEHRAPSTVAEPAPVSPAPRPKRGSSKPAKPRTTKPARNWNPDSALPPM